MSPRFNFFFGGGGRRGNTSFFSTLLEDVKALKACAAGERVTFRARVLRTWEIGGLRVSLAGDESALTRIEMGGADAEPGRSYEFRNMAVMEYPARRPGAPPWHSASIAEASEIVPLASDIPVSQDEAYIERTYRILAGIQTKKARREGRAAPWRHPAKDGWR